MDVPGRVGTRPSGRSGGLRVSAIIEPAAQLDVTVAAGDGFSGFVPAGGRLRIVDVHGNQAVDTLFFDAADLANRYSAFDTIREQGSIYLTTGTKLMSSEGNVLAEIVADTCGRHDTLGGACAARCTTAG